jgi:hypothetical protein
LNRLSMVVPFGAEVRTLFSTVPISRKAICFPKASV